MDHFEIVAHRGVPTETPENTIESFQRAVDLGADAIELDVRLTSDQIPVVYHYYYLQETTSGTGAIFNCSLDQLRSLDVFCKGVPSVKPGKIPTLEEILELFGGKAGLEIHIQGPEPESVNIIGSMLHKYKKLWNQIEVTSYETAMLLAFQEICPGLAGDLLFPRSESWMTLDIVQFKAIHLSRLAHARAVHLHPTQLSEEIVAEFRQQGIGIHTWDVNDDQSFEEVTKLGITRICTDDLRKAISYREKLS